MDFGDSFDLTPPTPTTLKTKTTKKKKLTTEQIIAIVLFCFVIVGLVLMGLAFGGVFNVSGATIDLTPTITLTPGPLPTFVYVVAP